MVECVDFMEDADNVYRTECYTEGKWTKSTQYVPNGITAGGTWRTVYHLSDSDTNAYFGQETVYLGLDLIQMEWDDGGKRVVIPIVSSPIDVVADGTPPVYTTSDVRNNWWKILLGVIALIVIIVLLLKFAPWLIYGLGKVIAMPFKALAALFKRVGKRRKERKEAKARAAPKESRAERKTRKRREQQEKSSEYPSEFDERLLDEIDWDDPFWFDLDDFNG